MRMMGKVDDERRNGLDSGFFPRGSARSLVPSPAPRGAKPRPARPRLAAPRRDPARRAPTPGPAIWRRTRRGGEEEGGRRRVHGGRGRGGGVLAERERQGEGRDREGGDVAANNGGVSLFLSVLGRARELERTCRPVGRARGCGPAMRARIFGRAGRGQGGKARADALDRGEKEKKVRGGLFFVGPLFSPRGRKQSPTTGAP